MAFNPHMMVLARDLRGLTQMELADRMQVGQGTLSKYETGVLDPPEEFVADLSIHLDYPESFFFEPGQQYGFPPFHYRRRKKLSKKALAKINAEMNIRRLHVQKLSISFPSAGGNAYIPEFDPDEYQGRYRKRLTPEDAARVVREIWMVPRGPIADLMDLIESNGGLIVPCDFGTDLIDALSQRIDGLPVLFFVNVNAPADRVRHTLAHELGHMVLHTLTVAADDEMEDQADAFAGAFLMPADEILRSVTTLRSAPLGEPQTILEGFDGGACSQSHAANVITPYQSKMFWIEMSKLGYRKVEPNEPPRETPKLLKRMIDYHLGKLGYTIEQVAQILHLRVRSFEEMYGPDFIGLPPDRPARPALRLVNKMNFNA